MERDLQQLEQHVERELQLLTRLPDVAPRPERVAQIRTRVLQAAAAQQRQIRWHRRGRRGVAVAAAVALSFGLMSDAERGVSSDVNDPQRVVTQWAVALEESSEQLSEAALVGWWDGDDDALDVPELDEYLDSLDTTMEQLGTF